MKKAIVLILTLCFFAQAAIRLQAQADITGYGVGAGLGTEIIPLLFEVGIEGSSHTLPSVKNTGSFEGVPYSGIMSMHMTRVGGYAQLHFPGLGFVPVIGMFANPILHFGTQNGIINIDGEVRPVNNGYPIEGTLPVNGSYVLVGFPTYFGPLFIEPAFGAQHLYITQYANYKNTLDAQLSLGVKF